jgi:hypothetical protein
MSSMTKRSVSGVVSKVNKGIGAGGAGTNRSGKTSKYFFFWRLMAPEYV